MSPRSQTKSEKHFVFENEIFSSEKATKNRQTAYFGKIKVCAFFLLCSGRLLLICMIALPGVIIYCLFIHYSVGPLLCFGCMDASPFVVMNYVVGNATPSRSIYLKPPNLKPSQHSVLESEKEQ